jgi:hypothetical protein
VEFIVGYKIVEIKDGKIMSLFHGTNKSRQIPLGVWHKANIHQHAFVIDSADIVFETLEDALAYLEDLSGGELRLIQ